MNGIQKALERCKERWKLCKYTNPKNKRNLKKKKQENKEDYLWKRWEELRYSTTEHDSVILKV